MPIYRFEVCGPGSAPLDEVRRECADDDEAELFAEGLLRGLRDTPSFRTSPQNPVVVFFFAEEHPKTLMVMLDPDGQLRRLVSGS